MRLSFLENIIEQSVHGNFKPQSCVFICLIRFCFFVNNFTHSVHLNMIKREINSGNTMNLSIEFT